MTWLGPNIAQPPKWDSRDWADVTGWVVDGAHAKASGATAASARQYGRALPIPPDFDDDVRPGPWQSIHSTKIDLAHNQAGSVLAPSRGFTWTWERSSIDGRAIGGCVILSFGDVASGGTAALYWGGPAIDSTTFFGTDVIVNADTDYILEIDCVGHVNARLYEAGDEPPDWDLARPFYTGHGAPTSSLRMEHIGAIGDILLVDQIDISMGPAAGQVFGHIVVGIGDEVTDTFFGQPTLAGTVEWYVDGILTKPKSYDETTGRVTFDRPPQFESIITQVGKFGAE